MLSTESEKLQLDWSESALSLMRELLPLMTPVAQYPNWKGNQRNTIASLVGASARSSESVLLLTAYGQAWDAELVLRSVTESTLKLTFLLQDRNELDTRHTEFADDLPDIAVFKDHSKATKVLDLVPNPDGLEWAPLKEMLLDVGAYDDIKTRFSSTDRKRLESKWGFTGLISSLLKSNDGVFAQVECLAHGYSMSSHILHADYIGVSLPSERNARSDERMNLAHLSHIARLIGDVLRFQLLRLTTGYRFVGHRTTDLAQIHTRIEAFCERFEPTLSEWRAIEYGHSSDRPAP